MHSNLSALFHQIDCLVLGLGWQPYKVSLFNLCILEELNFFSEYEVEYYFPIFLVFLNIPSLFFSHYWIPGIPQYNFLKKLNIKDSKIIFDALSADTIFFQKIYNDNIVKKEISYPHKFFYACRIDWNKGIKELLEAWRKINSIKTITCHQ